MAEGKSKTHPDDASTKAELLRAAKKVFAAKGLSGATVKDICEEANCNTALISYHFGGKEQLYRSVVSQFGLGRLEFAQRILKTPTSVSDFKTKLSLFFEEFLVSHIEEPEMIEIMNRECTAAMNPVHRELFETIFIKVFESVVSFMKEAKSKKILAKNIDPFISSSIIFTSTVHTFRMTKPMEQYFGKSLFDPKFRAQYIEQLVWPLVATAEGNL